MTRIWNRRRGWFLMTVALVAALIAAAWYAAHEPAQVFTLEPHDDSLYVPVTFGGSTHLCEIDSGCAALVFHTSVKGLLGERELTSPSPYEQRTIGGTIVAEFVEPMDFQLGSDSFNSERSVMCCDMTHTREAAGVDIEGLIGLPFFHSHIVRIDFDDRRLEILPTSTSPRPEWGRPVNVFEEEGRANIDIEVGESEKLRFSIDTGNTGSLSIPSNIFSRLMKTDAVAKVRNFGAVSLAGFFEEREGILSKIRIGDFEIHGVGVDDGPRECLLGMGCLSRFRVTFDLPNRRLYLARGDRFKVPDRLERVGLFLLRRKGHTVIGVVRKGSAAEEAGIQADDELIAVDDDTVLGVPLAGVWWKLGLLSESDDPLKLLLRRAGADMTVSVTPHE